jgi:beta-galactosidase/beta-glucuronidase
MKEILNNNIGAELDANNEKLRKKKILIYLSIFLLLLILLIVIILIIYLSSKEKENKDDSEEGEEEKWNWVPKWDKLKTRWGSNLTIDKVWQEYPRPQLERKLWLNLNGPWSYKVTENGDNIPEKMDNKILVPFCLESPLSGVKSFLYENQTLFYEKQFTIPKDWINKKILLHFGAVDWKCTLYLNGAKVGEHEGGYSAFYFDITKNLNLNGKNKIVLKVIDPTNKGYQPVGKQTLNPHNYWYHPVSGIWQTVWLEPVSDYYIEKLEINNDYDNKTIKVIFKINSDKELPINITLKYNNSEIEKLEGKSNQEIIIQLKDKDFHDWSPTEPNLYIIKAELYSENGDILDSIQSYTAIRKIESRTDSNEYQEYI